MKPNPKPTRKELFAVEELLNLAALRMNGYDYMDADPATRTPEFFQALWKDLTRDPEHRAPTEDLMASLFFYQRSGPREVGWFAFYDEEHQTGLRLWLRLRECPTPTRWRLEEYATGWERCPADEKNQAADLINRWLTQGEGTWRA
jgi:hypothetical protein